MSDIIKIANLKAGDIVWNGRRNAPTLTVVKVTEHHGRKPWLVTFTDQDGFTRFGEFKRNDALFRK